MSLNPSVTGGLVGGLTGGSFAVLAQIVANLLQRCGARRAEERAVRGILRALLAELAVIEHDFLKPLRGTLQKQQDNRDVLRDFHKDAPPLQLTPSEQNYFAVFDSNASVLGRISDEQLLQDIVRAYGNAKGLFDYLNANPRLHEKWSRLPDGDEKSRTHKALIELEEYIRTNTAQLQTLVTTVASRINEFLAKN